MEELVEIQEILTVEYLENIAEILSIDTLTHQIPIETISEIEILKKSLQHYEA